MFSYRTRAINNCGLNSGKTFWVLVCGYYSREATIRKKTFFCTRALLFPCLQLYFTELIIKNFRKLLVFQVLIHVTTVTSRVRLLFKKNFLGPENCGFYSREVTKREHLIKDIQLLS